ncbi:MAG: hypothetical protein U5Q03_08645 [Bacteroidota bacterium]|nr:hypothetical protein [Bacteroidota bacterium]
MLKKILLLTRKQSNLYFYIFIPLSKTMEIFFGSKAENNKRREDEFLKLSPTERLIAFFKMIEETKSLSIQKDHEHPNDKKGNFVLLKDD